MARQKEEESRNRSIRLPVRLWEILLDLANREYRSLNAQVWMMLEDWLVERGNLKEEDRRRRHTRR